MTSEDLRALLRRTSTRDGAAFGLLSSHSRLHGCTSYRVPWAYDEEAVDVVRYFAKLKARLMPYLYRNAIETAKTGVPMMRSMVLGVYGGPELRISGQASICWATPCW